MKRRSSPVYTVCMKTSKRGYEDKLDALTWASRTAASGGVSRPYECPHCGMWHLTSWPAPGVPSRRA